MRDLCVERRVEQHTVEAVLPHPKCFRTIDPDIAPDSPEWLQWSWSRPDAWVSDGSQAEAAATA